MQRQTFGLPTYGLLNDVVFNTCVFADYLLQFIAALHCPRVMINIKLESNPKDRMLSAGLLLKAVAVN